MLRPITATAAALALLAAGPLVVRAADPPSDARPAIEHSHARADAALDKLDVSGVFADCAPGFTYQPEHGKALDEAGYERYVKDQLQPVKQMRCTTTITSLSAAPGGGVDATVRQLLLIQAQKRVLFMRKSVDVTVSAVRQEHWVPAPAGAPSPWLLKSIREVSEHRDIRL